MKFTQDAHEHAADNMELTQDDLGPSSQTTLPSGFKTIRAIHDLSAQELIARPLVSVVGMLTDFRPPVKTSGLDWKCQFTLKDDPESSIQFDMFAAEKNMPKEASAGDILVVRNVRVSMRYGNVTLLTHFNSQLVLLHTGTKGLQDAVQQCQWFSPKSAPCRPLADAEIRYVEHILKDKELIILFVKDSFDERAKQALNVKKEKFSLLSNVDVGPSAFYDVLVEVIHIHNTTNNLVLHATDYTSRNDFYNREWTAPDQDLKEDEVNSENELDHLIYKKRQQTQKQNKDWKGPWGKTSTQFTLWDQHADFAMNYVKEGDWIKLGNVKFGKGGSKFLEGYLRSSQNEYTSRNRVEILQPSDLVDMDEEDLTMDQVRLKEAVRRKMDYWKEHERQKEAYYKELEQIRESTKRKAEQMRQDSRDNFKRRRKEKRAAERIARDEENGIKIAPQHKVDANLNVQTTNSSIDPVPLSTILDSNKQICTTDDGYPYTLPFVNGKYRAIVRILDFKPDRLEDFVRGRRKSEYDMLSDYSGDDDDDPKKNMRLFREGKGYGGNKIPEWAFCLLVEEAFPGAEKRKMWLDVNNAAGEMLLNAKAKILLDNQEELEALKERLFLLWGDLAEQKNRFLAEQAALATKDGPPPIRENPQHTSRHLPGDMPALDSDDENDVPQPIGGHAREGPEAKSDDQSLDEPRAKSVLDLAVRNKPFVCCIQQYGIKVRTDDLERMDAGRGKMYQRRFGIFGTAIV